MPAKVIDTSVIAAWCFHEPRATEAAALIKDSAIVAPFLLAYELTSIARRKTIAYPKQANEIAVALRIALSFPISWTEIEHMDVLRIALETKLTTYDACYLYLSRKLNVPLVTFDEQLEATAL